MRIQQLSDDVLQLNQGSLYPALHSLEHKGWIRPEIDPTEQKDPWAEPGGRIRTPHLGSSSREVAHKETRTPKMDRCH